MTLQEIAAKITELEAYQQDLDRQVQEIRNKKCTNVDEICRLQQALANAHTGTDVITGS